MTNNDTIAAIATGPGGALGIVRLSGPDALRVCDSVFRAASGKPLADAEGYTLHYGRIVEPAMDKAGGSGRSETSYIARESADGVRLGADGDASGLGSKTTGHTQFHAAGDMAGSRQESAEMAEKLTGSAQSGACKSVNSSCITTLKSTDSAVQSGSDDVSEDKQETAGGSDKTAGERLIDDVVISVFRAPRSFTGEDMAEISCHGSRYIQQEVLRLLINNGARTAQPGEFTMRAFLAGKLDLVQAEAVADMIASSDRMTHALATNQMRGGYTQEFAVLRDELVRLTSLLELELDFGEEDVEFADRAELTALITAIRERIGSLTDSFRLGNAIKEGVAVAIAGSPNVGKSTLLNALLRDDRAMVSDIPGTTRDVVEESINLNGIRFRFLDTAGIRQTDDTLEQMGIERTMSAVGRADIVLLVVEAQESAEATLRQIQNSLSCIEIRPEQRLFVLINKIDKSEDVPFVAGHEEQEAMLASAGIFDAEIIPISARSGTNIDLLLSSLSANIDTRGISDGETVISNMRHYEALLGASESLERAGGAIDDGISADFISQDIRESLHHLGLLTGEITTDEVLGSIFSNFCIGK